MVWLRLCPYSANVLDELLSFPLVATSSDSLQKECLLFLAERFQTACDVYHVITLNDRETILKDITTTKTSTSATAKQKNGQKQQQQGKKKGGSKTVKANKEKGEEEEEDHQEKKKKDTVTASIADAEFPASFVGMLQALQNIVVRRRMQLSVTDPTYRNLQIPLTHFPFDERLVVPLSLAQRVLSEKQATILGSKQQQTSDKEAKSPQTVLDLVRCASSSASSVATSTDSKSTMVVGPAALIISPSISPLNPSRREKNIRLLAVERYEQERQYNQMVQTLTPGAMLHGASNRSGALNLSSSSPSSTQQKQESYASFMKDVRFGLDMRLMSLAGSIVGYYLCHVRGFGLDVSLVGAAVGAIVMMFVDAALLMIRIGKEDAMEKDKKLKKKRKQQPDYSLIDDKKRN